LTFYTNFYETSYGNVIKQASGKLFNFSGTSLTKSLYLNYNKSRFFLSHDFSERTDRLWTRFSRVSGMWWLRLY